MSSELARVSGAAGGAAPRAAEQTTLVAAVDCWADTLSSSATRRSYRHAVLALLGAHGQVTARTVAAWRDEQLAAGLSHATVRQRMAAVRAFAAWATRTGRVRIDDTLDLAAVQAPRSSGQRTPAFVSVEQLRLLDVARRQRVA